MSSGTSVLPVFGFKGCHAVTVQRKLFGGKGEQSCADVLVTVELHIGISVLRLYKLLRNAAFAPGPACPDPSATLRTHDVSLPPAASPIRVNCDDAF